MLALRCASKAMCSIDIPSFASMFEKRLSRKPKWRITTRKSRRIICVTVPLSFHLMKKLTSLGKPHSRQRISECFLAI